MDQKEATRSEVEIEDYGNLDKKLLKEIKNFVSQEKAGFRQKYPMSEKTKEYRDERDHQLVLSQSTLILDEAMKSKGVTGSICLVARVDGKLAGFSVSAIIEKNGEKQAGGSFVGVRSEFTRRGIATKLIQRRHDALQQMGINEYKVALWDKSEGIFRKLHQSGEFEMEHIGSKEHDYIIRLNPRD